MRRVSCPMSRAQCHGQCVQHAASVSSMQPGRSACTRAPRPRTLPKIPSLRLCPRNIFQHPQKPQWPNPSGIVGCGAVLSSSARLSGRSSSPQRASASAARASLSRMWHVLGLCPVLNATQAERGTTLVCTCTVGPRAERADLSTSRTSLPAAAHQPAHIVCVRRLFVCAAGMRTPLLHFPSRCSASAHIVCVRRLFVCAAAFLCARHHPFLLRVSCPMSRAQCHGQCVQHAASVSLIASSVCLQSDGTFGEGRSTRPDGGD